MFQHRVSMVQHRVEKEIFMFKLIPFGILSEIQ